MNFLTRLDHNPRLDLLHQLWEMLLGVHDDPAARDHLDLNVFIDQGATPDGRNLRSAEWLRKHLDAARAEHRGENCGTVGCAMGFAKLCIPEIRQAKGLRPTTRWFECDTADILGIDASDARTLFYDSAYDELDVTPKMVADRVKKLIDHIARLKPEPVEA
jgi:hypothetical protein